MRNRFEPKPLAVALGAAIMEQQYQSDSAKQKALFDNGGERVTFQPEDEAAGRKIIDCPPVPNPKDITNGDPPQEEPVTYKSLIKAAAKLVFGD
jgi:hypothetical protein